jgi:23S rRNA U2552 (ribose-2'-O)-methylase RlmE/FtsJ
MEVILFRKNEITSETFKNQLLFKIINYPDVSDLKNEMYGNFTDLDHAKAGIDLLDKNAERNRRAAAKYLHEYELVKNICKKQVISRAYFKLYEIIYHENVINLEQFDCFFICEAPGGFIEAVCDIRRKKNLQTNFISISKFDRYIKYDRYLEESRLFYGDITEPEVLEKLISSVLTRFPNKLDFITADGGFDVKIFNAQEVISTKLLLCEMYLAMSTQKIGGTFVIKFFDMFTHNSNIYYFILCACYNYVKIIKPKTSRNCNSERYIVCYSFKGSNEILNNLWTIILHFKINNYNTTTLVYPNFDFTKYPYFIKKISTFNNLILYEQIKTINESIKMVHSKDLYLQNLILSLFLEKNKKTIQIHENLLTFKHILQSRIKKCIDFLRNYNINMVQIKF